jgi:hypothetical protein
MGPSISAGYYFPMNFRYTRRRTQADFFIAFTRTIVTVRYRAGLFTGLSAWEFFSQSSSIGGISSLSSR